ncbi:MAG: hypothetical protein IPO78_06155 [Saprospiraceae bacterium]|nr:hypothetical protein [Saprospiraceae bacterium]MBK8484498.1 hypothetical protein [Saprospiraceae bacterium]MBK9721185.1 hypothetical protein [Saprospiraceae bacterium]
MRKLLGNSNNRAEEMNRIAAELNLSYQENYNTGIIQQLSDFKLFQYGSSQKITNLISESELNSQNHLFDFEYVISTGKSSVRFNQTVLFVNSKTLSLPQFYQKPEDFFTKLISYLGFEDIDFSNFPEYSEKFHLKGEFEEVIRYYFSKEVLELLSRQNAFHMEAMNYYFIIYQSNKLCPIHEIKAFRNMGIMLYKLFQIRSSDSENMKF